MPTYEYRCDACGHEFSAVQHFGDEPIAACPKCGARPRRLVSRPAIVFKGSGWHINDYRRARDGAGPAGDGEARAKPGERSESPPKSETSSEADESQPAAPKDKKQKESAPAKPDSSAANS